MLVRSLSALAALAASVSSASALVVPFTEDFATTANWRQATSTLAVNAVAGGGPGGASDSYVSYARNFGTGTNASAVFRGQDGFDASGDAFVGDWVAGGVKQFSFFVRHNAPAALTFGTRFATSQNFPAYSALTAADSIAPNVWTQVVISIDPNNAQLQSEGAPSFESIFGAIGNVQILAQRNATLIPENTTITLDLDRVAISTVAVPEPTTLLAAAGLALTSAARRRRA